MNEDASDPFEFTGNYKPVSNADTLEILSLPNIDHLITTTPDANVYAAISGVITSSTTTSAGYRTIITGADGTRAIYNNLSTLYPRISDTVTAGCLIGKAGPKFANTTGTYDDPPSQITFDVRDADSNQLDWSEWIDPYGDRPCGEITGNCVNANPALDNAASGWQTDDGFAGNEDSIVINNDSVTLDWNDSIRQTVVLDDPDDWYVTLVVAQVNTQAQHEHTHTLEVTLGDAIIDRRYGPVQALSETIVTVGPLSPTTTDYPPDMYNLKIRNSDPGFQDLRVSFVCLHKQDQIEITPSACYLKNWQLANHNNWQSSTGADWRINGLNPTDSHVWLSPGEWIAQPISLQSYATENALYTITVGARVGADTVGDITDLFVSGWESTFSQTIMDGVIVKGTIGNVTINNVLIFMGQTTEFQIALANSPVEGDLTIEALPTNTKSVDIDYVCINPVTGIWPGSEDDDLQIEPSDCQSCAAPDSINPIQWFAYLICVLRKFWACDLMVMLNNLLDSIFSISNGIGFLGRWLSAVWYGLGQFFISLLTVFGTALRDVMAGIWAAVWNQFASVDIIRSLYDLISLILIGSEAAGTLIDSVLGLFSRAILTIASLARVVGIFQTSLWAAVNDPTTANLGLPNCGNEADPLYPMCIGFTMVNHTIDTFPALSVASLIVCGCLGVFVIVWTIRQFGSAAGDM